MRKNSLALYLTIFFIAATFLPTFIMPIAASPDEVVVLTPHWSGIQDVAKEDFEAWYNDKTGNDVVLTFEYKDTTTSLALIREAGGDPTKVKWDVWWGGGLDAFKLAKAEDLLAPFYLPGDTEWEDINSAVPDSIAKKSNNPDKKVKQGKKRITIREKIFFHMIGSFSDWKTR